MPKLIDIFKGVDKTEYFGILDEETNNIVYVTSYDLQKKYCDKPLDIEGVKHTNLNSIGYKLVLSDKAKVLQDKNKIYKEYAIKSCIDYYKLQNYVLKNIPIGYRIIKDGIVYTYQKSSRMGLCWQAHLFAPYFANGVIIEIEKNLLGYPVRDLNHFFESSVACRDDSFVHFYDDLDDLVIDLSNLDLKDIQDISYFLSGMSHEVYFGKFDMTSVLYCDNAFQTTGKIKDGFQILDFSDCVDEPFLTLNDTDVFKRNAVVQVIVLRKNSWLEKQLIDIEATDLGTFETVNEIRLQMKKEQGKYAFMKKPFEKQIYFARVR